jgi:hypothetical protein
VSHIGNDGGRLGKDAVVGGNSVIAHACECRGPGAFRNVRGSGFDGPPLQAYDGRWRQYQ